MTHLNRTVVVTELKRDAEFVGQAAVAVVFFGFTCLAVGAALVDLIAISQ